MSDELIKALNDNTEIHKIMLEMMVLSINSKGHPSPRRLSEFEKRFRKLGIKTEN